MKATLVVNILILGIGLLFGQVAFSEQTHSIPGLYNSSIAWGDYDNDGD